MDDRRIVPASTVKVSPHQVSTSLGQEVVILGADAGQYFGLNEVGTRVWELVQQPVKVSEICATICAEYEVAPESCERDVIELLGELQRRGLVDVGESAG